MSSHLETPTTPSLATELPSEVPDHLNSSMSPHLETPSGPFACLLPELLLEILSHLSPGALKSWSLLSRTFLPRAQKFLFASLTVRVRPPPTQHTRPVRQLSTAADLLTLLSASPHLAEYVRRLSLELGEPNGLQSKEDGEALLSCVPLLSGLRELRLECRPFLHRDASSEMAWFAVASLLQSTRLKHLQLYHAPTALTTFCASVKRLSFISGYDCGPLDNIKARFSDTPLPRLKVEELCVNWYNPEVAEKNWVLCGGVDVAGLKRLSFIFSERHTSLMEVACLIRLCAPGLEELNLEAHVSGAERLSYPIDLSALPYLRTLRIGIPAFVGTYLHLGIPWIICVLFAIPPSNMIEQFELRVTEKSVVNPKGWADLVALLSHSTHFPCLRQVGFAVYLYKPFQPEKPLALLKNNAQGLRPSLVVSFEAPPLHRSNGMRVGFLEDPWFEDKQ